MLHFNYPLLLVRIYSYLH